MLKEDLRDELIAIRNYGKHIAEANDPVVKEKLTEIKREEEHHAEELMMLLSRTSTVDEVQDAAKWDESKHPRAKNGQFGRGGSAAASSGQTAAKRELVERLTRRMESIYPDLTAQEVNQQVQRRLTNPGYFAKGSSLRDLAIRAGIIHVSTPTQRPINEMELRALAEYFVRERNVASNRVFDLLNNPEVVQRSINHPQFNTIPEEIQTNLRRQLFTLQNTNPATTSIPTTPTVQSPRTAETLVPPAIAAENKKHDAKKIDPLKANIRVARGDAELAAITKKMLGESTSKHDVIKLAGGFDEMVKNFTIHVDSDSNVITVDSEYDNDNPVKNMTRTIKEDSIHMDLFVLNSDAKGQNIAPRMLYQSARMAQKFGIWKIETHAAGSYNSGLYNGYYTWARCGYDQKLEAGHIANLAGAVLDGMCTKAEWDEKFSKYTHVSQFMETKQGRDMWKRYGSNLYYATFDTRKGSKSMKVLKAYLKECGIKV